jgi:hypothetical protein
MDDNEAAIWRDDSSRLQIGTDELVKLVPLRAISDKDNGSVGPFRVSGSNCRETVIGIYVFMHRPSHFLLRRSSRLAEVNRRGFAYIGREPFTKGFRVVGVNASIVSRT